MTIMISARWQTADLLTTHLDTIAELEAEATAWIARRDATIDKIIADAQWMDIPILTGRRFHGQGRAKTAVTMDVHVFTQTSDADGRTDVNFHHQDDCGGGWCSKRGEQRPRGGRRGYSFTFVFLGTWRLVRKNTDEVLLIATPGSVIA